ncbi:MAG: hypothetical protein QOJ81_104 [Chloroflexota bacterium]|jgi:class 3 adenylate cyclase|nr:hypothetical protein [Chloroflexota bacterium]
MSEPPRDGPDSPDHRQIDHALVERQIQAINRFPDQNPHPVLRVADDGQLTYANISSAPVLRAMGAQVGRGVEPQLLARLRTAATEGGSIELGDGIRTYAVLPVAVPELGFTNLYGTDITAEKVVAKFPGQNPNPVLRMDGAGTLIYANDASRPLVTALGLTVGQALPAELHRQLEGSLAGEKREPVECVAGELVFEITPVEVPEFGFFNLYGTDVTAARQLARAKEDTERLLLNILPPPIANRLRSGERVIADRFEDASLLMADIVGFTEMSSHLSADALVEMLNDVFSELDLIVERYELEKVKTIGDAYMVVGGVPEKSPDHLERMAGFALDLAAAVGGSQASNRHQIRMRIGINAGPVVAGVIGQKRTIYDIWGDTVNLASRMESLGEPGRIHVTPHVADRLKGAFDLSPRGEIDVKGKGPMSTWWLEGRQA